MRHCLHWRAIRTQCGANLVLRPIRGPRRAHAPRSEVEAVCTPEWPVRCAWVLRENLNSTNRLSARPLPLFAWVTLHLCLAPHHQHHQPAACVRRTPPGTPAKPNATRHQRHRARHRPPAERERRQRRGHTRCGKLASSATRCHANASAHDT